MKLNQIPKAPPAVCNSATIDYAFATNYIAAPEIPSWAATEFYSDAGAQCNIQAVGISRRSSTIRIQTVTTMSDGVTPTLTEAAAAARIRVAFPRDQLILIPKVMRR